MKHLFYVIYIAFYTGAVFMAGMFLGQMLERAWAVREKAARSRADETMRVEAGAGISVHEHKTAVSGKQ